MVASSRTSTGSRVVLNPVASRAARGQRWLNFGFNTDSYIWPHARARARASRAMRSGDAGGDLG